jgi:hypothetical protein
VNRVLPLYQRAPRKQLVEQLRREDPDEWEAMGEPEGRLLSARGPYSMLFLWRRYESLCNASLRASFRRHRKLSVIQIVMGAVFIACFMGVSLHVLSKV